MPHDSPVAEDRCEPEEGVAENSKASATNGKAKRFRLRESKELLSGLSEYSSSFVSATRLFLTATLVFILIGTFYYPDWWYTFLLEGGIFSSLTWTEGWDYWYDKFWLFLIILFVVLVIRWLAPRSVRGKFVAAWYIIKANNSGRAGFYLRFILVICLALRFSSLNDSVVNERGRNAVLISQSLAQRDPLARPTSFVFLAKDSIDSLYGQYEPNLLPFSIIEEIKNSTDVKAGVNVEEFLKTEIGKNEFQRKLTEYRQSPKNSERKLGDLLRFLLDKASTNPNYLKRYGNLETKSADIVKLDNAIEMLRSAYNLSVDSRQLTLVRDRLLVEEMKRLIDELKELHGLVLVEGDWSIDVQPDGYVLRRAFVENVTDSPICEAKISRIEISSQNKEIIESLKGERMRLSLFGNVVTSMPGGSKTVRVNPIAVF